MDYYRQQTAQKSDDYRAALTPGLPPKKDVNEIRTGEQDMGGNFSQELVMDEHLVPLEDLFARYNTDPYRGLQSAEAQLYLERDGPNVLTPPPNMPMWIKVFRHLFSFFNIMLWITAVLCFVSYIIMDGTYEEAPTYWLLMGVVLVLVIFITGGVMYYHDWKSDKVLNSFNVLQPHFAMVVRDGTKQRVRATELVMGDLVELRVGDRVPADIRVVQAHGLRVDNSILTGEEEPQTRTGECTNANPLETKNLLYYMTFVAAGWGTGLVVNVADHTVMGRIANLSSGMEVSSTQLAKQVQRFSNIVLVCSFLFGFIFFSFAFNLNYYWLESIVFMVSFIAACYPEGLGATVTVCMTLTASRMLKKNCLVKHLEAVETLGSVGAIVSNLTGCFTHNKQTVAHVFADGQVSEADLNEPDTQAVYQQSVGWQMLVQNLLLANSATFKPDQDDLPVAQRETYGNSVDSALLKFASQLAAVEEAQFVKVTEYPYDQRLRLHVTVIEDRKQFFNFVVIKGSVEAVLERCSSYLINGVEVPLDQHHRQTVSDAFVELATAGEKVVAIADFLLPEQYPPGYPFDVAQGNFPLMNYRLVGLVSLNDPARAAVPGAVVACQQAGIRVVLVTGEHPLVATAKAKEIGLIGVTSETVAEVAARRMMPIEEVNPREASAAVIGGSQLASLTPSQLDELLVLYKEVVFCQVSPAQKIAIVGSLKRLGHVVLATGTETHDVPALEKADVGVALGQSGTDIAKDACDVMLLDDNFASIVFGIEEGRLIFDNVKKSILYTLTSNMPQVVPFFAWMIFDIPLYIGLLTILAVDLGTDLLPALSFAYERPEDDIMRRKPRNPRTDRVINERMLSLALGQHGFLETAGAMFAVFVVCAENGFWPLRFIGLRREWDGPGINDLEDSYGQEWSVSQRGVLRFALFSTYFVAIVLCQWVMLLITRTKTQSVVKQQCNYVSLFALVFETILAIILVYVPGMDLAFNMYPIRIWWWFPVLPFALTMLLYDEARKFFIRRYGEDSFFGRETLY